MKVTNHKSPQQNVSDSQRWKWFQLKAVFQLFPITVSSDLEREGARGGEGFWDL